MILRLLDAGRRPAILPARHAAVDVLPVVVDRSDIGNAIRLRMQRMRVDDAELAVTYCDDGPDINATLPAQQKIGRPQAKLIALQAGWVRDDEGNAAGRIGGAECIVRAAESALACTDEPAGWRDRCLVAKPDSAAMAVTLILPFHISISAQSVRGESLCRTKTVLVRLRLRCA